MNERKTPPSLDDLDARLHKARADAFEPQGGKQGLNPAGGLSAGIHVATELVVAMMVAVAIGWYLDDWLETKPLFLLVFFFLGAAAGALNVYRRAQLLIGGQDVSGQEGETKNSAKPPGNKD